MTTRVGESRSRPFSVFLIAGEESGDQLGAGLMRALSERLDGEVEFFGVGGERMAALGLESLYPMHEVGLHGILSVVTKIGNLLRRRRQTVEAVLSTQPDILLTIDIPSFNLGVARRVRDRDPSITNIHYVMPSVWAYRPGRARKMAPSIDHVLALLPFEPEASRKLHGPPCSYVGHLLIERLGELRPQSGERRPIEEDERPTLVVLPGSRRSEIKSLLAPFGKTISQLVDAVGPIEVVLPAVSHQVSAIRSGVADWAVQPTIVEGENEKFASFRRAQVALAASGTVTLELALSGVPMVVAYRIDPLLQWLRFVFRAHSIVLSNLVLGQNVIPEFIDWQGTPKNLVAALAPLFRESPERSRQIKAFEKLDELMTIDDTTPSERAVDVVLETVRDRQRRLEIGI